MTLFHLKMPKTSEEKESKWEPLDCLPPPYVCKGPVPEPSASRIPGNPQANSPREGKEVENEGPYGLTAAQPLP
jgi:hypothetical protein